MAAADQAFPTAVAEVYDAVLGPFMFEPFARETARRFAGFDGEMLEIAAGTGAVTRALDQALAPTARITATDLSPAMLATAAGRLASPRVAWRPADALALPFPDARFDAAVCQFGVMFYPDQAAGHREAARVLRPGGRYLFSVWGDLAGNPVAQAVHQAAGAFFPNDPPLFFARTPHGHHDLARHRRNLADAGFRDIAAETLTLDAGRLSAETLAAGFCQGTPLRGEIEARDPAALPAATAAVAQALRARFGDGDVESTICAHLIAGVR